MTEQWQELKETITEMRDNDGTGTQQDACKFLVDYMEVLEKQMQEPCEDCISREAVQDLISRWLSDYLLDETREALETINYKVGDMPSVTPRTNLARTSQDCISRQKALDCFEQTNTRQGAKYAIETLPSVTPKYTDEEIDRAQAVEQAYVDKMVELAVKETKRPKGKWIRITNGAMREKYICSECGRQIEDDGIEALIAIKYPYCHCGAEMRGGGEDEDSN